MLGALLIAVAVGMVFFQLRGEGSDGGGSVAQAPAKRSLKLTVPAMERVRNIPVYGAPVRDEAALRNGALHVKNTGFPWEDEANVYIAGHRLGYPRTESFLVFWDLNKLKTGDKVLLRDSEGKKYVYRVFDRFVVGPKQTRVKKPVAGRNIVSLQTCTLPDYADRLIVRAELVNTIGPPTKQS